MVYNVFIDKGREPVRHSTWTSYTDSQQQVKALRDSGQKAWWEFKPEYSGFGADQVFTRRKTCEV